MLTIIDFIRAHADQFNGLFEFGGGLMILKSVFLLHQQKMVRGVSKLPVFFFTSWGFYNLFYYPHLGQWWSFSGGCVIVTVNAIWLAQIVYYRNN